MKKLLAPLIALSLSSSALAVKVTNYLNSTLVVTGDLVSVTARTNATVIGGGGISTLGFLSIHNYVSPTGYEPYGALRIFAGSSSNNAEVRWYRQHQDGKTNKFYMGWDRTEPLINDFILAGVGDRLNVNDYDIITVRTNGTIYLGGRGYEEATVTVNPAVHHEPTMHIWGSGTQSAAGVAVVNVKNISGTRGLIDFFFHLFERDPANDGSRNRWAFKAVDETNAKTNHYAALFEPPDSLSKIRWGWTSTNGTVRGYYDNVYDSFIIGTNINAKAGDGFPYIPPLQIVSRGWAMLNCQTWTAGYGSMMDFATPGKIWRIGTDTSTSLLNNYAPNTFIFRNHQRAITDGYIGEVNGDLVWGPGVTNRGIVVSSPNGHSFRLQVSDSGTVTAVDLGAGQPQ